MFGHDAFWRVTPPRVGTLGKFGRGLPDLDLSSRGGQFGLRCKEISVQLGRLDGRQKLSRLDVIADIDHPCGDITADSCVDRALVPCGRFPGQHQRPTLGRLAHDHHFHQWRGGSECVRIAGEAARGV